ncbi:BAR/IMD domain-containing adapter protein 2-like isoform X2 [Glandiceps talaboti]
MPTSEEIGRMTEGVYKHILEGLHPGIRHMVAMGRAYEKALVAVSYAAKAYFESIVKLGELASETKASRQLGEILLQISATLRDIETQREIAVHSFHKELLVPVEATVDQLQKDLLNKQKNYLQANKTKTEVVEKARNDYKKYQKKSQKNTTKYTVKERQCGEEFTRKQQALDEFRSQGLKTAWQEERRRYCFLILRQCAVLKNNTVYHGKAHSLYRHRLPDWQKGSDQPDYIPTDCENILQVFKQGYIDEPNGGMHISRTVPSRRQYSQNLSMYNANFTAPDGRHEGENVNEPLTVDIEPGAMMYPSATLPNPKRHPPRTPEMQAPVPQFASSNTDPSMLPKSTHIRNKSDGAMALLDGSDHVRAVYNHSASGQNQLSFNEGDLINVIGQRKNGWQFGQNMNSRKSGWFPVAYMASVQDSGGQNQAPMQSLSMRPRSEGNLLDLDPNLPMPDYHSGGNDGRNRPVSYTGLLTTAPPPPPPMPEY